MEGGGGIGIGTGQDGMGRDLRVSKKENLCEGIFFLRDSTGRHSIIIACTEKERECVRERRKSYRLRCLFLFVCWLFFFFDFGLLAFGFGWENWKGSWVGLGWVGLGERVGMEWNGMG